MKTFTSRPDDEFTLGQIGRDRNFLYKLEEQTAQRYRSMVVRELMQYMNATELEEIRLTPRENIVTLHHSLGAAIRNEYELWMPEHEVTAIWVNANYSFPLRQGQVDEHPLHPDNFSMSCVEELWEELQ